MQQNQDIKIRAKCYLSNIRWLDHEIDQNIISLNQLKLRALSVGAVNYDRDIVQSSNKSGVEAVIAKIIDQQIAINNQIDDLAKLKETISGQINTLAKPEHRAILTYRYVCLCKMDDIAVKMGYERRHVTRLHSAALYAFAKDVLQCPADM